MSLACGLTRIWGSVKYCLISTNARSYSSFYSTRLAPFRVVKKGFSRSVNREIKRSRVANRPVSCWISFLELGAGECKMALSCAGFASILLCVTIKPRNLPALTPKAHLRDLVSYHILRGGRKLVGDELHDPGAVWTLPAYHQYKLPWWFQVRVETFSLPTSDRLLLYSLSRRASRCNSRVHGG